MPRTRFDKAFCVEFINNRTVRIHSDQSQHDVQLASLEGPASVEPAAAPAPIQPEAEPEAERVAEVEVVTVVGSRSTIPRSSTETAAPVDVIESRELARTGQTDLTQMVNFTAPSFNSARQTIANGTDHIDPATLRGLGPDQVLVLINGKRQHTTALVNVNSTVGRGSVGYDLNTVPTAAIERIEVLRDGAAAQYGSDAIAGVVNIVLKSDSSAGTFASQFGRTKQGDGDAYVGSLNQGFRLGERGFLNATLSFSDRDPTDRSGTYNNTVYLAPLPATRFATPLTPAELARQQQDNDLVMQRGFDRDAMIVGNSKSRNYNGFFNAAVPVGEQWRIYSFGGYNQRDGRAAGFYRFPNATRTRNLNIYPNGYLPFIETDIEDRTAALGFTRTSDVGWQFDLSGKYGANSIGFEVDNSLNASLGDVSPTHFYSGKLQFAQYTTNLDLRKRIVDPIWVNTFNMAFGVEYRVDQYQIEPGEEASYRDFNPPGTPPAQILASGVQVFGGFRPSDAVDASRSNVGVYADFESDVTDKLLLGVAGRYENYSDFGSNLSGKLVGRYMFSDAFSLRAGINRGFRAPSLHQQRYSAVSTQFITVGGVNQQREVTTVPNDAPITRRLGIAPLEAETSLSYSVGVTSNINNALQLTLDAYQIDIDDRVVISGRFSSTVPQLAQFFAGTNVTEAQFFTNAIDTRTRGVDAILTYRRTLENSHVLSANLALNYNKTEILGGAAGVRTPPQLDGLGETLLNREERGRIEVNQPRDKAILTLTYQADKARVRLQATRFGEITTVAPQDSAQDQTFAAKVVTDASFAYQLTDQIGLTIGANNLFDVYPDKVRDPRLTNDGTVPYSRFATQFGFNGAFYFAGVNLTF
ncbi:MAG: TonB-dependent receptor [Gammaproteobacteria bacterium]|nr:TonB-dependent receptor [Gammaproteobacteria bacterium]